LVNNEEEEDDDDAALLTSSVPSPFRDLVDDDEDDDDDDDDDEDIKADCEESDVNDDPNITLFLRAAGTPGLLLRRMIDERPGLAGEALIPVRAC